MANSIAGFRKEHPNGLMIILAGSVHGQVSKGMPWDKDFIPMGHFLKKQVRGLKNVRAVHDNGEAWVCTHRKNQDESKKEHHHDENIVCGPTPRKGLHREPARFMKPSDEFTGYDGILYVGAISSSPPVHEKELTVQ